MDIKAITKTVISEIKEIVGIKTNYAKVFKEANINYYQQIFKGNPLIDEDFVKFIKNRKIMTALEIGCSIGLWPTEYSHIFNEINYTGLDISQSCIEYCKAHSDFNFICADFLKMENLNKYDLVFSMCVIDHIYDIDLFLTKIAQSTKKYAYISTYKGYFPDLETHSMRWSAKDGVYYNKLSVKQIKKTLLESGLSEHEFEIRQMARFNEGFSEINKDDERFTVIITINKD